MLRVAIRQSNEALSGHQQLVHTADKLVRIFQRTAFSEQRLIQQQLDPTL